MRSFDFVVGSVRHVRCAECGREGKQLDMMPANLMVANNLVALICGACVEPASKRVMGAMPHRSIVEVDEEGRELCG